MHVLLRAGWQHHPVCVRRMHFVVPAAAGAQSLADPSTLPAIVEARLAGRPASAAALPAPAKALIPALNLPRMCFKRRFVFCVHEGWPEQAGPPRRGSPVKCLLKRNTHPSVQLCCQMCQTV